MAAKQSIPIPPLTPDVEAKLLGRLLRSLAGCWEWQGARAPRGYGRIVISGLTFRTHRIAYTLFCGNVPVGFEVCHNCPGGDNPSCCNPTHLFLGTHSDNMKDASIKGTCRPQTQRGGGNGNSVLDEAKVRNIRSRAASAKSQGVFGWKKALAEEFGVSHYTIYRVVNGILWAHVS